MSEGVEIRDAGNTVILTLSDRITRILGSVAMTGGTNSSVTNAGLTTGAPYWWASRDAGGGFFWDPSITVSGDTISWTWPNGGSGAYTLVYAVY